MATKPVNVNHEGYSRRLDTVQRILQRFGLKSAQISTIAYVEHCPFPFNNFIYKVELHTPAVPASFADNQPCTLPPPEEGVSTVIVRMSNPLAEGLNNANRVENDVAAQHLVREALHAAGLPSLVPAVYAWERCRYEEAPDETGFGWTIGEFKPGSDLDGEFPTLAVDEKKQVMKQIADIFAAIQQAQLPQSITQFGALTIDDEGQIVNGQMPLLSGGPWDAYADVWVAKLRLQLEDADKSPLLQGWSLGGLREQINAWIEDGGVPRLLNGVNNNARVLVHGDLTMNNFLFDVTSKRITAILDFDWAAVTHPADEFFTGLWDLGGGFDDRTAHMTSNILQGDFEEMPPNLDDKGLEAFGIAKAWNEAVASTGAARPSSIEKMDKILALRELETLLCPFALGNEMMLKRISDEQKALKRQDTEAQIIEWFSRH
ncbi:hypothetical protein PFICI_13867 [Pestalotiopsis fici W106-1]|uniref:Aminoglycoside phosphotransferase domain-containing protein n=1 Tax=Pestalotiopsis fici (strain W106-1 / CGMCC3.15140) TaxID=1229662 RepID=W3WMF7_PESFW|nr:uncharacterized protein PFICI_13867 [Pestalotiopsis fici W106-1]ETS74001.1 hypothetical protein PFICI_13867 [Pestalotiopsis fici W106-1]